MSKLPPPIIIGKLQVGYAVRPKIIAEIGINHFGSLDLAKKMAQLAVESGADIVKTRLHPLCRNVVCRQRVSTFTL